jgi:hypothetical protein
MRLLIGLFSMLLLANQALACRYYTPTDEDKIKVMEAAYYGVVTGIQIPALESLDDPRVNGTPPRAMILYPTKRLRIAVFETFKGSPTILLEIDMKGCGGGDWFGEIGDQVVVYLWPHGSWWVDPASDSLGLMEKHFGNSSP